MPRMTGGEAVVRTLQREGVEMVFALPGVQIMSIFDAFYGQDTIRLVTTRHEQATTYMADGYARVTGRPGVALVVPGPGVQNASAGLGTAYASSSPLLLLAGQVDTPSLGKNRGALHEINDQLDVVRPVTKWCARVLRVEDIPGAIHEAMRQMRTGRPRPTEVEVPIDVLRATGDVELPEPEEYAPSPPAPDPVRRAVDLLLEAHKPLIWAGGGVNIAGAAPELQALAEALKAPVAMTPEGKGTIPDTHPCCLGVGYYGHGAPALAMPRADVVLAVGTRLTGLMRGSMALRSPHRLVHVDVDPEEFGRNYPPEVAVQADASLALRAMLNELRARDVQVHERWPSAEVHEIREATQRWLRQRAPLQLQVIQALRHELDDDAIVVAGVTNIAYWSNLALEVPLPQTYLTSSYFATLGYAFPLALGAKLAAPHRQVMALTGDGGFLYAASELATAVQHGINLVTIVFRDNAFGASLNDQRRNFGGRVMGTTLHNPDFVALAEAFGAQGIRARSPQDVGPALRQALDSQLPTVVEVPMPTLDPPFYLPPPEMR